MHDLVSAIVNHGPGLVPVYQESPVPRHSDSIKAAIKSAVGIVALVGDYLQVRQSGSKFKALCPFHDDHNPSLELNPERQTFKCWSCGVGGDIFDFIQKHERVDFPEALRMLAERAGIVLDSPSASFAGAPSGPTKSDLLAVNAWAEELFAKAITRSEAALSYVDRRGLSRASVDRFRLGYAPEERGWLMGEARRQGYTAAILEQAGLISRPEESPGLVRERFRGRLIFPIHDERGRAIGFGGRILPEVEQSLSDRGKNVAKYLNSPETALFQKRKTLYAADLARAASRQAGWVAVVEGYTDVIAAHQVGLCNVVGTLGTALGDDHVLGLRRLADRAVLIFDGDEAGQKAADRALEFFLGHELDVAVMSLPENLDPCDFLLDKGADAFRELVDRAVDPLAFILDRARTRFDFDSIEDSRRAAEWVLGILCRVPSTQRIGMDLKLAKALDTLSTRLDLPIESLHRRFRQLRRLAGARPRPSRIEGSTDGQGAGSSKTDSGQEPPSAPIRLESLDPIDRELIRIVLNEPGTVATLVSRITVASLRDEPLREILRACYDLHAEGQTPSCELVMDRLDDPQIRALAAGLVLPFDPHPMPEDEMHPASWQDRLAGSMATIAERERQIRLRDLKRALEETDQRSSPDTYSALLLEWRRLLSQKPHIKKARRDSSFRA